MPNLDRGSVNWKTLILGLVLNVLVFLTGILLYHAYIVKDCWNF